MSISQGSKIFTKKRASEYTYDPVQDFGRGMGLGWKGMEFEKNEIKF